MTIPYNIEPYAFTPVKAHKADAGYDLRMPSCYDELIIAAHSCAIISTGVHFAIPEGYVGFIKSKSGLNVKHNIQSEGVIDSGYTGSVVVKLYNHGDNDYVVKPGDKITQIVFLPIPDTTLECCASMDETERGDKGFGSSGR